MINQWTITVTGSICTTTTVPYTTTTVPYTSTYTVVPSVPASILEIIYVIVLFNIIDVTTNFNMNDILVVIAVFIILFIVLVAVLALVLFICREKIKKCFKRRKGENFYAMDFYGEIPEGANGVPLQISVSIH